MNQKWTKKAKIVARIVTGFFGSFDHCVLSPMSTINGFFCESSKICGCRSVIKR